HVVGAARGTGVGATAREQLRGPTRRPRRTRGGRPGGVGDGDRQCAEGIGGAGVGEREGEGDPGGVGPQRGGGGGRGPHGRGDGDGPGGGQAGEAVVGEQAQLIGVARRGAEGDGERNAARGGAGGVAPGVKESVVGGTG